MAVTNRPWARDLLYCWFHVLGPAAWFAGGEDVDAFLKVQFGRWLTPLGTQSAESFLTDRATARAAILLFDQLPRNLFRDDPRAYRWDPLALAITHGAIRKGWHRGLSRDEAQFVLMPLMHSEAIADQRLSLRLFMRYAPGSLSFARSHHRMIARFGRFPHRNAVLGRHSTAAEIRAVAAGFSW
ncbi:DUF924 family protein [Qipengyuania spongiae]|uniref:DUF924 domain-containing protein n=1 Tax=Qipengyuania spongiae TaxID=2909673 RepID=A0ABY5T1E6_9SPHN|nr:DUF924 family protein [Qipengyuania spongiae]UVI40235.1 DUF924 domain-containing protein [Qipengyuania spongiae]